MEKKVLKEILAMDKKELRNLVEEQGGSISKTTLSKIFSDGSEDMCFSYENTLRPIANALLDIENIEEDDDVDAQAMKSLLKYKIQRIKELENQVEKLKIELDREKLSYYEKLEKEQEQSRRSIDFLKEQISLKDKRMDFLFDTVKQILETLFHKERDQ